MGLLRGLVSMLGTQQYHFPQVLLNEQYIKRIAFICRRFLCVLLMGTLQGIKTQLFDYAMRHTCRKCLSLWEMDANLQILCPILQGKQLLLLAVFFSTSVCS